MKIGYDPDFNILHFALRPLSDDEHVDHRESVGDDEQIVVEFDANNRAIGFEVQDAQAHVGSELGQLPLPIVVEHISPPVTIETLPPAGSTDLIWGAISALGLKPPCGGCEGCSVDWQHAVESLHKAYRRLGGSDKLPYGAWPDHGQAALEAAATLAGAAAPPVHRILYPRAVRVRFEAETMVIDLVDGRSLGVPLAWYPGIAALTPVEREQNQLQGDGVRIMWTGEHIVVPLLFGVPW
jgi:uncharacterized protein YuzE